MKKTQVERPAVTTDNIRGDVKPIRDEIPAQRPSPTPKPPKKN